MSFKNHTNSEVTQIKKGEVEYLEYNIFNKYADRIKAFTTLKHGGVSNNEQGTFSFNGTKEEKSKNLKIIAAANNIAATDFYKATQNHTNNILVLNEKNKEAYEYAKFNQEIYDAYITNEKNIFLGVVTADCNPIIIFDENKNVIANIHSGWKGTYNGICIDTIQKMKDTFSCKEEDMIVCIGPSIGGCCFESSDPKFKDMFTTKWREFKTNKYIKEFENGKFLIDLKYIIKEQLKKIGIKTENISDSGICTMCEHNDFFSYRRSLKDNIQSGRILTVIGMI